MTVVARASSLSPMQMPTAAGPAGAPAAQPPTWPPLFDFPGIAAGDRFRLTDGTRVPRFGKVSGEARIDRLDDAGAAFHLRAGKFGFKTEIDIAVERLDESTVMLRAQGDMIPSFQGRGSVVDTRTNYLEFASLDYDISNTVIQHDGAGLLTIDAEVPEMGRIHLVLEKVQAALADATHGAELAGTAAAAA